MTLDTKIRSYRQSQEQNQVCNAYRACIICANRIVPDWFTLTRHGDSSRQSWDPASNKKKNERKKKKKSTSSKQGISSKLHKSTKTKKEWEARQAKNDRVKFLLYIICLHTPRTCDSLCRQDRIHGDNQQKSSKWRIHLHF